MVTGILGDVTADDSTGGFDEAETFLFKMPPLLLLTSSEAVAGSDVGEVGNDEESNLTRSSIGLLASPACSRFRLTAASGLVACGSRNTVVLDTNEAFLSGEKVKDERLAAADVLTASLFSPVLDPLDGDLDLSLSLEL